MRTPRALMVPVAGGLVVILVAWFMLVYRPKGAEVGEVRAQAEAAEGQEQSLRATLAQLESIDEDRPEEEAEVRRLTAAVPPQPELASFILTVHDAASRSDLAFLAISPSFPTRQSGDAASAIAASIDLEGDFFDVIDFLGRLEDLERITVVDSVSLSVTESEEGTTPTTTPSAPAAALGSPTGSSSSSNPSAPVEMTLGTGAQSISVRTDAATAGRTASAPAPATTTTSAPRAEVFLLPHQAVTRLPNRLLRVSLQARIFTTAAPAPEEGAVETTTTTAPGSSPTTVPTTVPAGGGA